MTLIAPASTLPTLAKLEHASTIVHAVMPATPQQRWPLLDQRAGSEVWVKHENQTPVGAFKVRGGLVFFHELVASGITVPGVVTATRGNHGQSIGLAAARHGIKAAVIVPRGNSIEKDAAMRALGVELIEHGDDFQASVEYAARLATEREWYRVPSFHPWLVQGVGTYALESCAGRGARHGLRADGLGSGICGMIAARDALGLPTEIVGVVSSHAPAYALSMAAARRWRRRPPRCSPIAWPAGFPSRPRSMRCAANSRASSPSRMRWSPMRCARCSATRIT